MNPDSFSPPPGRRRKIIGQPVRPSLLSQAQSDSQEQSISATEQPTAPSYPPKQQRIKPSLGGPVAERPLVGKPTVGVADYALADAGEGKVAPLQVSGPSKPAKVKLERVPNFAARGHDEPAPLSYQPAFQGASAAGGQISQAAAQQVPTPQTARAELGYEGALRSFDSTIAPSDSKFARSSKSYAPCPALDGSAASQTTAGQRKRLSAKRVCLGLLSLLVALIVAYAGWGLYLANYTTSRMHHINALSAFPESGGETWLIAGSDERSDGSDGGIEGNDIGVRTDSLILVRKTNSESMIVSLPRDTAVEIPGHGINKINAAYPLGGPGLLVETVENLTGVKINHYLQVSMGAVTQIVDALGGVNLCYDRKVHDVDSALDWPGGCQLADGKTALAFSRMRKADPLGDIGRALRQRQVVSQMVSELKSPSLLFDPFKQKALANAVSSNLIVDNDTGVWSLLQVALAYRAASAAGLSGAPPISDMNYHVAGHGSMVKLDTAATPAFWLGFKNGTLRPDQYQQ